MRNSSVAGEGRTRGWRTSRRLGAELRAFLDSNVFKIGFAALVFAGALWLIHRELRTSSLADVARAAALTFYLGAALLLAAGNAPVRLTAPAWLLAELPRSVLMSSGIGALLLVLSAAIWRRQEAAYFAALLLLFGGGLLELWRGFGLVSAAPLLILGGLLAPCRSALDRRSVLIREWAS